MVSTRGKKKIASSNKILEENEAAENGLAETQASGSLTVDVEEPKLDAQLEDKVELTVDEAINEKNEEMDGKKESEKVAIVDNDDDNTILAEMNSYDMAELEKIATEDDEEDIIWEDHEEYFEEENEENVDDDYEVSEEEVTEEEEDGEDDISKDEATEEDNDEDEISAEEAKEQEVNEQNTQEQKKLQKEMEGKPNQKKMEGKLIGIRQGKWKEVSISRNPVKKAERWEQGG
ncbi:UNVERIFIED_CONTAM: hypothetical protein Sradi_0365700 [Sesamum radiatum]|uniref:Uncharacterized protein n=1 Tax=Sesamum radiatum TaxID=300843 RepID=A0AAW2W5A2_SESRA